jgi:hypothetical protein
MNWLFFFQNVKIFSYITLKISHYLKVLKLIDISDKQLYLVWSYYKLKQFKMWYIY